MFRRHQPILNNWQGTCHNILIATTISQPLTKIYFHLLVKAFLTHEKQYQNKNTCAKNHYNKWPNRNWPAVLKGKLDVKFSQREKCVIFLNLNSEPQASRIWPLTYSRNIGINTNNHLQPLKSYSNLSPQEVDTQPHSECLTYLGKQW